MQSAQSDFNITLTNSHSSTLQISTESDLSLSPSSSSALASSYPNPDHTSSSSSSSTSSSSPSPIGEESEDEGSEFYKLGGYHPVHVNEIFNSRYRVVRKLGWGHYSTVWKVVDIDDPSKAYAMKVVKSAKNYTRAALDEIKLLNTITHNDPFNVMCCTHLIDSFMHEGPNGIHCCMIFEMLGSNLLDLIKFNNYKGLPVFVVKFITYQIIYSLNYIHTTCGLIHTDLKPENVLLYNKISTSLYSDILTPTDEDGDILMTSHHHHHHHHQKPYFPPFMHNGFDMNLFRIKLADFGNANWVKKHFTDNIQTRQYRCPEIILGNRWGPTVDMWSVACIVYELLTGEFLFKPRFGETFSKEDDHLAQITELLGDIPMKLIMSGRMSSKYFAADGSLLHIGREELRPCGIKENLMKHDVSENDAAEIADFMHEMLIFDPSERRTAGEMLGHPWLKEVSLLFEKLNGHP